MRTITLNELGNKLGIEVVNLTPVPMKAINSKHQTTVNRACAWLKKYNTSNTLRDEAEGNSIHSTPEDDKEYRRLDNLCQKQFNQFLEYMEELPKREQQAIYKSDLY